MEEPASLVERIRAGDFAAFETIYDRHHQMVYALAWRLTRDRTLAEDITQDVFTKFWAEPYAFRGGNFAGWLARVARNRTIDILRARRLRPEDELPNTLRLEALVDDDVLARIDGEHVREALRALPEEQRTLIELGFFSGITHQELANQTGVPLGTVKTRIRNGLRKMRATLGGYVTA